mgnify:FL=1
MNSQTQKFRQQIAEQFIHSLQEKSLNWERPWVAPSLPINAATEKPYKGINRLSLMMAASQNQYSDPRWATFVQIQKNNWKLKAGSKGTQIEYWMPFDPKAKQFISWSSYENLSPDEQQKISLRAKYYYVFNAAAISGIPPLPIQENKNVRLDNLVSALSQNMKVPILSDVSGRAYYAPDEDAIHIPSAEQFKNSLSYNTTCFHELAHATGAAQRLNRNIRNPFGSAAYAYEELIAEITSVFMAGNLDLVLDESDLNNHKAYVQSWILAITDHPEALFSAIKEASKACDYMEYHADLIPQSEFEKRFDTYQTGQSLENEAMLQNEIKRNGYRITPALAPVISQLSQCAPELCRLHLIKECFQKQSFSNEAAKFCINKLASELCQQEKSLLTFQEPSI